MKEKVKITSRKLKHNGWTLWTIHRVDGRTHDFLSEGRMQFFIAENNFDVEADNQLTHVTDP